MNMLKPKTPMVVNAAPQPAAVTPLPPPPTIAAAALPDIPPPPTPSAPPAMPDPLSALQGVRQRAVAENAQRAGRQSTILTTALSRAKSARSSPGSEYSAKSLGG